MIIAVASGKGGTGKTTIAVSLALAVENDIQFLDSDVEEPNAHIFLRPIISEEKTIFVKVPQVDLSKCNFCSNCSHVCNFNAIAVVYEAVNIFAELCHSCGACKYFCPQKAITEIDKPVGLLSIGKKDGIEFVQGKMNIGQAIPVPTIKAVKKYARNRGHVIIDAPPGNSCSMIHSVVNVDYCILVTEPTLFGLHDLKLAIAVLVKLKIPYGVIINRSDLGDTSVMKYCRQQNIEILMQIPFSYKIAEGYAIGRPFIEILPEYRKIFQKLFNMIKNKYG